MTFTSADLLKFGLHKTRKAVRVAVVEPTSQAGGAAGKASDSKTLARKQLAQKNV